VQIAIGHATPPPLPFSSGPADAVDASVLQQYLQSLGLIEKMQHFVISLITAFLITFLLFVFIFILLDLGGFAGQIFSGPQGFHQTTRCVVCAARVSYTTIQECGFDELGLLWRFNVEKI